MIYIRKMKTSKRDVSRNSTLFPILFTSTDDEDGNPFAVTSPCSLAARSSTSKAPSCTLDNASTSRDWGGYWLLVPQIG